MDEKVRKQKILIVDDVPANIRLLGRALKSDYHVMFATSGEEALKIAMLPESCDLILLDIMMPGMSGYDVCRELKANPKTQNIPVIFITAMSSEDDEAKGLEIGAVDYIIKPFSMSITKARVRTHLELKRHRDMLENLSSVDGLTGIANRRRFDEFLKLEWLRAKRETSSLSLILIDIDHFKPFNDNYGHNAGDDCLKKVAIALNYSVKRPPDLVARYGGEEFGVVLPRTDLNGAALLGETMRKAVENLKIEHAHSPVAKCVTISVGTGTTIPSGNLSSSALIEGTDRALYKAKAGGRNQVKSISLKF